jgi:hypothetical protein
MVAECELKSPSVLLCPLFQRGNFLRGLLTPPFEGLRAGFGKACPQSFGFAQDKLRRREGKGSFLGGIEARNYVANFSYRTPDSNFGRFWFDLSTHP